LFEYDASLQDDFKGVLDGMMKQLMGKDIMYEPIKAMTEKVDLRVPILLANFFEVSSIPCGQAK
jgi:hypothetical protein